MTNGTFKDIEQLESDLWEAADNLRANSKLTSSVEHEGGDTRKKVLFYGQEKNPTTIAS